MKPTRTAIRAPAEGGAPNTEAEQLVQLRFHHGAYHRESGIPRDEHCDVCFVLGQLDAAHELWRDAVACESRDCGCSARIAARVEKEVEAT